MVSSSGSALLSVVSAFAATVITFLFVLSLCCLVALALWDHAASVLSIALGSLLLLLVVLLSGSSSLVSVLLLAMSLGFSLVCLTVDSYGVGLDGGSYLARSSSVSRCWSSWRAGDSSVGLDKDVVGCAVGSASALGLLAA